MAWITVRGNHIPIMRGESKMQAIRKFIKKNDDAKVKSKKAVKPDNMSPQSKSILNDYTNLMDTLYNTREEIEKLNNGIAYYGSGMSVSKLDRKWDSTANKLQTLRKKAEKLKDGDLINKIKEMNSNYDSSTGDEYFNETNVFLDSGITSKKSINDSGVKKQFIRGVKNMNYERNEKFTNDVYDKYYGKQINGCEVTDIYPAGIRSHYPPSVKDAEKESDYFVDLRAYRKNKKTGHTDINIYRVVPTKEGKLTKPILVEKNYTVLKSEAETAKNYTYKYKEVNNINRQRTVKNAYKEYLKEHPNSKMKLSTFEKNYKNKKRGE